MRSFYYINMDLGNTFAGCPSTTFNFNVSFNFEEYILYKHGYISRANREETKTHQFAKLCISGVTTIAVLQGSGGGRETAQCCD